MSQEGFLYCTPSVFVIGDEYEILINLREFGICFLKVGDEFFYEENSGVLPSERTIVKIRVPQSALNQAKSYEIIYRKTKLRRSYYSLFEPPQTLLFPFKALDKTEDICIYYLSDAHYAFDIAKKTASYFGDDTDLFVINGDIGEVETVENYLEVCRFVGEIAGGKIPVLFSRGNHDTRGRFSELYPNYFPCDGKKTYYEFTLGVLHGVVLDCGEDKVDNCKEYDSSENTPIEYLGINRFHDYRKQQLEFLKAVSPRDDKITFAVSHICPSRPTGHHATGNPFDIERQLYAAWCKELDRIAPKFMLCGHEHHSETREPNDKKSFQPHNYPVVIGLSREVTEGRLEHYHGTAIRLYRHKADMAFTDETHTIVRQFTYEF